MIFLFYLLYLFLYLCFILYIRFYICFVWLLVCISYRSLSKGARMLRRCCNAVRRGGKAATAGGQRQHESDGGWHPA